MLTLKQQLERSKRNQRDRSSGDTDIYKQISVTFFIIIALLIIIILYFYLAKAEIFITANVQKVPISLKVSVMSKPAGIVSDKNTIIGTFVSKIVNEEGVFMPSGKEDVRVLEKNIIIFNKTPKSQPLVVKTRFLTKDDKLFRLVSGVVVPANGKIEVTVRSDKPLLESSVTSGRLTIPGLFTGLQSKIYGELISQAQITSNTTSQNIEQTIKIITKEDIKLAENILVKQALSNGTAEFKKTLNPDDIVIEDLRLVEIQSVDAKPVVGMPAKDFTVKIGAQVNNVAFNFKDLEEIIKTRISKDNPSTQYMGIDKSTVVTRVLSMDNKEEIKLDVTVNVDILSKNVIELIRKEDLANKSPDWVTKYLQNFKEIKNVRIELSPFWVTNVPGITDHIYLKLEP